VRAAVATESVTPNVRASRRRFLAAVGDSNDPRTWSGIPYHFLQASRAAGLIQEGLPLSVQGARWRLRRWAWNSFRVALGDRKGGYQYSVPFLETLWAPHTARLGGGSVFNCFQLFPPSIVADGSIEKWFYIDQTLTQLFDHYGLRASIGRKIAADAVARERQGYLSAEGIIAHSRWAAHSVIEDYGVPDERVHVVNPGANLDLASYDRWESTEITRRADGRNDGSTDHAVRFVSVGKDWRRKGLDRLLAAFALARKQTPDIVLQIIGCEREALPSELRDTPGVEWAGFVDKGRDPDAFVRQVASCDVGCLLSRAEAGGIALREFHALGLAVLCTSAGGAPEHASPEAGWLVGPDAPSEAIAQSILEIAGDRNALAAKKEMAWSRRRSFLYPATVETVISLVSAAESGGTKAT
jgi:glycosyltransferase involved in cell wall biosynthesis